MECGEVLHLVFMRLSSRDLAMACCCSKFWCEVGYSDHLWRSLCMERWPGCGSANGRKVIEAMGGFRMFYMRRALTMSRPPKHLQPRPWLRLEHLTFFVDLTYKGFSVISDAISGNAVSHSGSFAVRIDPHLLTDAILPCQALTPLFYQGQLYYEKPFQTTHASEYWLTWSVVRSTDHKMACLLHNAPVPEGVLPWEQDGEEEGDEFCLPLLFQAELKSETANGLSSGLLKQPALLSYGCLDCRPVWGDSLSEPMRFKLVELQLGIWRKEERCPPPLDKMLLALQELDWK